MNNTTKRAYFLYVFIIAFLVGIGFMFYSFYTHGEEWASMSANRHLYSNGQIINAGSIYDRNGVRLAYSENGQRGYNESETIRKAFLHSIGDTSGYISTGVQSVYGHQLSGYDFVNGVYNLKKYGRGNDVILTLDAEVCEIAYNAMGGRKGTVAVYNYKTGEIICMVSTPSFDPLNKPTDIDNNPDYEGVYINRFFTGVYTPGSTFKVITAACAIEHIPDLESRRFQCTGSYNAGTGIVKCNGVHGILDFEEGFNNSCNCVFAELAIELGTDKMTQTAIKLGFNAKDDMGDTPISKSSFNVSEASPSDLGWAGIGQYTTLANPCHMLTLMGAIANGGTAIKPYYINCITTPAGDSTPVSTTTNSETITLDSSISNQLVRYMRSNVVNKYGDSSFPGLEMCGKTGTAQIDNGDPHSWFVGFSMNPETPYAVVCVAENSGYGLDVAGTISNTVMQAVCFPK